jgi:raffinose/stachyose/melibiose transport system substrate-binding protein
MKTNYRIGALVVVWLFIVTVAMSAGGSGETEDVVELTYWNEFSDGARLEANKAVIEAFHVANPTYRIINRPIPNEDFFMALRTGFSSNDGPDIFQHENMETLWQFVRNDYVADISDWYKEHSARFASGSEKQGQYDGNTYAIPLFGYVMGLFYNKDLLRENGVDVPRTWPEFIEACGQFEKAGISPIALGNKHGWPGYHWLAPLFVRNIGAKEVMEAAVGNPEYHWNDPMFIEAAGYYEELSDRGYFTRGAASDDFGASVAIFVSGKAPFFVTGTFMLSSMLESPPPFEVGIAPFPQFPGQEGDENGICVISFGLSLSSTCKDTEGGYKFLDTFSTVDVAQKFVEISQVMSFVKGAVTETTADPLLLEADDNLVPDNAVVLPFLDMILPAEMGEGGILATGSVGILTGEMTATDWMNAVETEFRKHDPVLLQNMY